MLRTIQFLAVISLVTVGCLSGPSDLLAGRIFKDDFSDQDAQDDDPVSWFPGVYPAGRRDASTGDFVIISTRGSSTYVESSDNLYKDLSMRTQMEVSGISGGTAGLFARSEDSAAVYSSIDTSGVVGIWTLIDNDFVMRREAATGLGMDDKDVYLQFDLSGNQYSLTAWAEGTDQPAPQITWEDTTGDFPNGTGRIGIWQDTPVTGSGVAAKFRYVEVVPEPSSHILWMIALGALGVWRRRRRT